MINVDIIDYVGEKLNYFEAFGDSFYITASNWKSTIVATNSTIQFYQPSTYSSKDIIITIIISQYFNAFPRGSYGGNSGNVTINRVSGTMYNTDGTTMNSFYVEPGNIIKLYGDVSTNSWYVIKSQGCTAL